MLPRGFTNPEPRPLLAPLLGTSPEDITADKITYDLSRLRDTASSRIPHTRRYQVTDTGPYDALLFTHAHDHLLRPDLAQIGDARPPAPHRYAQPPAPTRLLRRPRPLGSPRRLTHPLEPSTRPASITIDSKMSAAPTKPS